MDDFLIIGGGVIGLSLAYELAGQGATVRLLERGLPGKEASWAGAGLLPPANAKTATNAYEQLAGLSHDLQPGWAATLREETGIDNGYRRTGSIHVARDPEAAALLHAEAQYWRKRQIRVEEASRERIAAIEPELARQPIPDSLLAAYWVPDEAQLRNPRHLKALAIACALRGVTIETAVNVEDFERRQAMVTAVSTTSGRYSAGAICLCGGAWSKALAARLGIALPITPVRGQMVLLAQDAPSLRRIVNEGRRYLVPRPDGRVLIGSTEEEAGFDRRTTVDGLAGLMNFALGLAPRLASATVEQTWAGLRPGTPDGLPYLGRLGDLENAYVAAGHFRGGIHLSPGTAVVMARLMRGEAPGIDLTMFSANRFGKVSEASPGVA
jgi:glycine oxidase